MAIVAEAQEHQIQGWRLAPTEMVQQLCVGLGALLRGWQVSWHSMQAGMAAGFGGHQGFSHHAGVAGGIIRWHPALITQQHIHPPPGQMLLGQMAIGSSGSTTPRQGDLGPIPLRQHQIQRRADRLGRATGQIFSRVGHHHPVARWRGGRGGHGQKGKGGWEAVIQSSHSVWKLPDLSVRS